MAKTTDERLDHVERVLDEHTKLLEADTYELERHTALLVALNEKADRQTAQLEAIVLQLRTMNEGIIRALSAATRLDALEERIEALEGRRG
jgi:hypothetical protein